MFRKIGEQLIFVDMKNARESRHLIAKRDKKTASTI